MTHQESIAGASDIACTLDSAGFAAQSERWTQVLARAPLELVDTEDGIHMEFASEPGVEQDLRELVAVESKCCSWAVWRVDVSDNRIVLSVASTGDGIAAIRTIFAGLRSSTP